MSYLTMPRTLLEDKWRDDDMTSPGHRSGQPGRPPKSSQDISLAARMQAGDEAAFSEFAARYGKRFRHYFRRHGLSVTDAEDLACTTVTNIALRIDRFASKGEGSFDRWVFTLAYREYVNWLREEGKRTRNYEAAVAALNCSSLPLVKSRVPEWVRAALEELPERDRDVLSLRSLVVPFSFAEIGELLGISQSAARVCHHRAQVKLRRVLEGNPAFREWIEKANRCHGQEDAGPKS